MAKTRLQDGFRLASTRRTLPIALLRLREVIMARFRPLLSRHGITEQQWRVIRVLQEADQLDAKQLAETACILAPSLSRILKALEERGFIQIRRDPDDGRRSMIHLTQAGDEFIRVVAPESAAIYDRIESLIGKDGTQTLLDEIDQAIGALTNEDELTEQEGG